MMFSFLLNPTLPDTQNTHVTGSVQAEIRASGKHWFYLVTNTTPALVGVSHTQIPNFPTLAFNALFRAWKISVWSTLDVACTMEIMPFVPMTPTGAGQFTDFIRLASNIAIGTAHSTSRFLISSLEPGTGQLNTITIPALNDVHQDLAFGFSFESAPTTGKLYIGVEAQK